jgi:hypothetical protein
METTFFLIGVVALVAGRWYAGRLAQEVIDGLPTEERARLHRLLHTTA